MPPEGKAPLVAGLVARARSFWDGLTRRDRIETEMAEEFRHHLEMRAADLMGRGLSPDAAARQARLEFGHVDNHKSDARASRGLRTLDELRFSGLDVKLGLRMLVKYRGLSLVSLIGMSVAITIGTTTLGVITAVTDPSLPLDEGDRLVSIRNWDVRSNSPKAVTAGDFVQWQSELRSVRELGAFRSDDRTLIVPGATPHLVGVAAINASGFRVARVSPVLGRPILAEDERPDAPDVVVIAHEEWQRRFDGDSGVLGRPVRLGSTVHSIVGVMPPGFRFPINHRYWVPLRVDAATSASQSAAALSVFGRIADGASLDEAQAELTTIGLRMAAVSSTTHQYVRPRVTPYTYPFLGLDSPSATLLLRSARAAIVMLLLLIAVNVAVLIYARTATRTGEIAVRTALGASRRRIVVQLFVEALALSAIAAVVGLTLSSLGLAAVEGYLWPGQRDEFPFWIDFGPSASLVAYAIGLAVATAVIVGVFPALKATGRSVQATLQQLSSRGSRMHLGRMWTALIIGQVAVAVAVLPAAGYFAVEFLRRAGGSTGYPAHEVLRSRLSSSDDERQAPRDSADHRRALARHFSARGAELMRRLEGEPAIAGVTFESPLEGYPFRRIETERGPTDWAFIDRVDTDFFAALDVPIVAGRAFVESDTRPGANGVIVNRVLAEQLAANGNVIGRRIRMLALEPGPGGAVDRGPWLEIVGVVPDFRIQTDLEPPHARVYTPVTLGDVTAPVTLSVRVKGSTALAYVSRLREVTAAVDPALQLRDLETGAEAEQRARRSLGLIALAITAIVVSVVLLSAAGIYAMMAFTVVRRRREIGIRSALGANPRRLLAGIFARASAQIGTGVAVGLVIALAVRGPVDGKGLWLLPLVGAVMTVVGLLAALGPARQGLAIPPTEALRED